MMKDYVEDARKFFSTLPEEKTREYEKQIARYGEKCVEKPYMEALQYLIKENKENAFEAFYCLCTVYRRNKDFDRMSGLIEENRHFQNHLSFNHIVIQYLVHSESFYDYDELLEMAYKDAQALSGNAGFLQSFCNAFATICERCDEGGRQRIVNTWYDTALACMDQAIELDGAYAKFYCTKARILALRHRYPEADQLILRAISLEDSSRKDYALTIMNYQSYRMKFVMDQMKQDYDEKIVRLKRELADWKTAVKEPASADLTEDAGKKQMEPEIYDGKEPFVFVSYAHKDRDCVYPILSALESRGVRIWYDKGIEGGKEWPEEVGNHIMNCSIALIMLSVNSVQSANVRKEANLALAEGKTTLVLKLDDVVLTPGMKLQFGLNQMIIRSEYNQSSFVIKVGKTLGKEVGYIEK